MKKWLENLIKAKKKQAEDLRAKSKASDSIEEVRAIGETLEALMNEIADAQAQLDVLEADNGEGGEGEQTPPEEGRAATEPQGAFKPIATYSMGGEQRSASGDMTDSEEYRNAFMRYVKTGERSSILEEARANANTTTTDASAVIPTTLVNRIVEKMESTGTILPLVNRASYASGVEIPVSSLKPTASWVNEGATSDKQKLTVNAKISFTYHKLRCEVSISQEVGRMALSAFEAKIVDNIAEAMTKAIEKAIIGGNGSGQPKGILAETPETGQAIALTNGTALSYDLLCEAEGALPQAYESGARWCMTKKTFMSFIGITDANGQPVARVNYGLGGAPERTLLGRDVVICGDYMDNFNATAASDSVFAFLFNFSDYTLNTIYDLGVSRRQDWDTEDMQTKAVMSVDGKVVDKGSLVTLTIKAAE